MKKQDQRTNELTFKFRKRKTFDPDLFENFNAKSVFNSFFIGKPSLYPDPAEFVATKSVELIARNTEEIRGEYALLFKKISADADQAYKNLAKSYDLTQKNTEEFEISGREKFPQEYDAILKNCLDRYLLELLPIIRVILFKFTDIPLFDVQLIAGLKLYEGHVLEMKTGEGKTFVIPLTAVLFGLRAYFLNHYFREYLGPTTSAPSPHERFQIHIVTANDYLARRDYTRLHTFYDFFNLSCNYIQEEGGAGTKRNYFLFDIVYCTCRHLCHFTLFDLIRGKNDLPHLPSFRYVAILDEIDQILLDEASTPYIISHSDPPSPHCIDIVYQANHLARTFIIWDRLFVFYQEKEDIGLSEPGRYLFLKILRDFYQEFANISQTNTPDFSTVTTLLESFAKKPDLKQLQQTKKQLLKNPLITAFLAHLHLQLEPFISHYLPFLCEILQLSYNSIQFPGENKDIKSMPITQLRERLENCSQSYFIEGFLEFFLLMDIRRLNIEPQQTSELYTYYLTESAFHPKNYSSVCHLDSSTKLMEKFLEFLNALLDRITIHKEDSSAGLKSVLFGLINYELPALTKFLSKGKISDTPYFSYFNLDLVSEFLCIENGRLKLREKLQELLLNKEKFVDYLKSEFQKLNMITILNEHKFFEFLIKALFYQIPYPIILRLDDFTHQCKRSILSQETKTKMEKMAMELRDTFLTRKMSFEFLLNMEAEITLWENNVKSVFTPKIPKLVQILLRDINEIKNFIESDNQSLGEVKSFFDQLEDLMLHIKNQEGYISAFATKLGITISLIINMASGIQNVYRKNEKELRNSLSILIASILGYLSANFSNDFFADYRGNKTPIVNYINSDQYACEYFEEFVIKRMVNPFYNLLTQLKIISPQSMHLFSQCLGRIREDVPLKELLEQHEWLIKAPFYEVYPSDVLFQQRTLLGAAKTVAAHFFEVLEYYHFAKNTNLDNFFILVQRAFNVNCFYMNQSDYLINEIDFNQEPLKADLDPYLNRIEKNEIQIIDRITGRVLLQNRWSQYIHSCVEAKEGLLVRGETMSSSQVTAQSYFGSYTHLIGLSGTTIIAKEEFQEKFGRNVEYIPPNRQSKRQQLPDTLCMTHYGVIKEMVLDALGIYYTNNASVLVILEKIEDCDLFSHTLRVTYEKIEEIKKILAQYLNEEDFKRLKNKNYPYLTEVWNQCFKTDFFPTLFEENSFGIFLNQMVNRQESFSEAFKFLIEIEKIPAEDFHPQRLDPLFLSLCGKALTYQTRRKPLNCEILDGRPENLSRESEIIRKAGFLGNILIATRVAGRGTDIKLEQLPNKKHPGLYTLIFNHQESRRHDQQVFGRCGRQGDVGYYRFYNSLDSGWFSRIAKLMAEKIDFDLSILPIALKNLTFEEIENKDENPFFLDFIEKIVFQFQLENEQASQMRRLYEKKLGDIAIHFQENIANITIIDQSTEITESHSNALLAKYKVIDTFTLNTLQEGINRYCSQFNQIISGQIESFIEKVLYLFYCGFELNQVKEILEDYYFSLFFHHLNLPTLTSICGSIDTNLKLLFDKAEEHFKKEKITWNVLENQNSGIVQAFKIEIFADLEQKEFNYININEESKTLEYYLGTLVEKPEMNKILHLLINEISNIKINKSLQMYNNYIELFKSDHSYSPFENIDEIVLDFHNTSIKLVDFLNELNSISIYTYAITLCQLFISIGNKTLTPEQQKKSLFLLKKLGFDVKPRSIQFDEKNLCDKIIGFFKLPISTPQLINLFRSIGGEGRIK